MIRRHLLPGAIILWLFSVELFAARVTSFKCPHRCVIEDCPRVTYCVGSLVKDPCGCCDKCPDRAHPLTPFVSKRTDACGEVDCPKHKVCLLNIQGLPLCTCPQFRTCRKRRPDVCGSDNKTYPSRCHFRVTRCLSGQRIKVRYRGKCVKNQTAVIYKPKVRIKTTRRGRNGGKYNKLITSRDGNANTGLPLDGRITTSKKMENKQRTRKHRKFKKRQRKRSRGKKRRRRYRSRSLNLRKRRKVRRKGLYL